MERWRPVPGYEGAYEVSDLGRVRSLERVTSAGRTIPGVIRKQSRKYDGHMGINLSRNCRYEYFNVHRLVLLAFVGPGAPGTEVLHRDGDGTNNVLANLHWGTKAENMRDQVRHGVHIHARKTECPKGHPYDDENTYVTPNRHRQCRTCNRARDAARPPRKRKSKKRSTDGHFANDRT